MFIEPFSETAMLEALKRNSSGLIHRRAPNTKVWWTFAIERRTLVSHARTRSPTGDDGYPAAPGIFPPVGGVRFVITSYSPEFDVVAPVATPDMHIEEGDKPGMHRTDSTDIGVLLSGNVVCELDDGAEVLLSAGDVLVQNG